MTFQTKLFAAATVAAIIALTVAGVLFATTTARQTDARIEQTLIAEAKLAAELLSRGSPAPALEAPIQSQIASLDAEADRIGELLEARVTFIARDGRVLGDSAEAPEAVATMENHAMRPEVVDARGHGLGRARRP